MSRLEQAICIAARAHEGQRDKGGAPYILHPLRVMLALTTLTDRIVGVLHDVAEDTSVGLHELQREGFEAPILDALDHLTRRENEPYEVFIDRISSNPIARRVKIADLEDNCDLSRIPEPSPEDHARREKYLRALRTLR